jgi:RNA recognition motif-containing protein
MTENDGNSKGFGFVCFSDSGSAKKAIDKSKSEEGLMA